MAFSTFVFALSTLIVSGASGCATDTTATDGNTTTTGGTTTVDDTSDTAMTETGTDTDDSTSNTSASTGSFYGGASDIHWNTECDPFVQDCPDGEKCVPWASSGGTWDANKCVPIVGDGAPGEQCSYSGPIEATDSCGANSICWFAEEIGGELVGTCTELCTGEPDDPQCPDGSSCVISNLGAVIVCMTNCDPLAQDCEEGFACYWDGANFNVCLPANDDGIGDPCDGINSCSPGSLCVLAETLPECAGSSCCAEYCSLVEPSCSQPGTECVPFYDDAPPQLEDLGICLAPGN